MSIYFWRIFFMNTELNKSSNRLFFSTERAVCWLCSELVCLHSLRWCWVRWVLRHWISSIFQNFGYEFISTIRILIAGLFWTTILFKILYKWIQQNQKFKTEFNILILVPRIRHKLEPSMFCFHTSQISTLASLLVRLYNKPGI